MKRSPYDGLPAHAFWRDSVSERPGFLLDPMAGAPFKIDKSVKVATGGSCFAQHIARRLQGSGYLYYCTETAPDGMEKAEADARNYGTYSARYGNIYTVRQLVQLFDRAFGRFVPAERAWPHESGGFVDPYRPRIDPTAAADEANVLAAAEAHLAEVRRLFETLDVFVFTLGLTESWRVKADGAVLPIVPGTGAGGVWNEDGYEFVNWSAQDVTADLVAFADRLEAINPAARIVLTVSPVPLVATYNGRHVIQSTAYSKAVLRVAAEQAMAARPQVTYFPSYEIITSAAVTRNYFDSDMRSVNSLGVDHVMRVFFRHFAGDGQAALGEGTPPPPYTIGMEDKDVVCDEEMLEAHRRLTAGPAEGPTDDSVKPEVEEPPPGPDPAPRSLAFRASRRAYRLLRSSAARLRLGDGKP